MTATVEELRLADLTDTQDAEVIAAEVAASRASTAQLQADLERITAAAIVLWEATPDEGDHSALLKAIRERLTGTRIQVRGPLLDEFRDAVRLGGRQALAQLGRPVRPGSSRWPVLPPEVERAARTAELTARSEVVDAARSLAGADGLDDLEAGLSRAHRAITRTEATASWGVNRSVAAGVTVVAEQEQASRLWVGERDACLHCLAYFGEVAAPGASFPAGLTFAAKPLTVGPGGLVNPPLHPWCRCRITLWLPEWSSGDGGYPEALKREARRSVARGWSLPTESNRQRLLAAERLLRHGAGLPKTVEEYAARSVRLGRFPKGRRFPG